MSEGKIFNENTLKILGLTRRDNQFHQKSQAQLTKKTSLIGSWSVPKNSFYFFSLNFELKQMSTEKDDEGEPETLEEAGILEADVGAKL